MNIKQIAKDLAKDLETSVILINEPMKKHTSFKVGGIADIYIKAKQIQDIKKILQYVKKNNIPLTIIGNGSNILVTDKGIRGIVLEVAVNEKMFISQEDGMQINIRSRRKTYASFNRMSKTGNYRA